MYRKLYVLTNQFFFLSFFIVQWQRWQPRILLVNHWSFSIKCLSWNDSTFHGIYWNMKNKIESSATWWRSNWFSRETEEKWIIKKSLFLYISHVFIYKIEMIRSIAGTDTWQKLRDKSEYSNDKWWSSAQSHLIWRLLADFVYIFW